MDSSTLTGPTQTLVAWGQERLNAWKQERPLPGLAVEVLVRIGRAHSEIPDTAKATDSNLIIMGSQGHGGLKPALLGGTAERVVRHACCPVLLIGGCSQ